jgi:tetraacyldisaccharide 4'-kinase
MSSLLAPLAAVYKQAVIARSALYRRGLLRSQKLNRPVISVGNLSVGGTGKTPLVTLLAKLMLKHGLTPAILTRGYGRRGNKRLIALAPASTRSPDPREAGDEPALLASDLPEAPIVICADRFLGGRYAEKEFQADVCLLDDGFQHLQLARNLDIVALDVTQELSDRGVLPAGRLREPCSALTRAQIIVLTRAELGGADLMEGTVRQIHPAARVFRGGVKLVSLSHIASGKRVAAEVLQGEPVFAFCAIGNPSAFFGDLERWGFQVSGKRAFPDHHVYTSRDTRLLVREAGQAQASALLTTRKDVMNLPPSWRPALEVYACSIEIELSDAASFDEAVFSHLAVC